MTPEKRCRVEAESRALLAAELRAGRPARLTVSSSSMAPALLPGDTLEVAPLSGSLPGYGDVVVFDRGGELIAHRVAAIARRDEEVMVLTRGDGAECADPPVPAPALLGKVGGIGRQGRSRPVPPGAVPHRDAALLRASFSLANPLPSWIARFGWERFLEYARREGLAGLIGAAIDCGGADSAVPETASRMFDAERRANAARNALCLDKLGEILSVLGDIPAIVLKGAYLAGNVYASPSMRLFSDIDLLVRAESVPESVMRLAALGYGNARVGGGAVPEVSDRLNSAMLYPKGVGPGVHLHWHLFNSIRPEYAGARLDIGQVWEQARPAARGGLGLCPEHLILHLSEHAVRHSFERLIWPRDIAEAILKFGPDIQWEKLAGLCLDSGLAAPVYHALWYVSRMTPVHVPETALTALRPAPEGVGGRLFKRLALQGRRIPEMSLLVYLPDQPSLGCAFRFAAGILFPPRAALARSMDKSENQTGIICYIGRLARRTGFLLRAALAWAVNVPAAAPRLCLYSGGAETKTAVAARLKRLCRRQCGQAHEVEKSSL